MNNVIFQLETTPKAIKSRFSIQQSVTDRIIKQMEAGTAPWLKPKDGSKGDFRIPKNAVTGNAYASVNILLLWGAIHREQYPSNEWASLEEWNSKNETIRPKQRPEKIVVVKDEAKNTGGPANKSRYLQYAKVFNRCQLSSYDPKEHIPFQKPPLEARMKMAEDFVANTHAHIREVKKPAYYFERINKISMPSKSAYSNTLDCSAIEIYYAALFNMLTRWTNHQKRLHRTPQLKFGNYAHTEEALIAELGMAFLVAEFGISLPEKDAHTSYLNYWMRTLKENKEFIFSAAGEASRAVGFLHALQPLRF